VDDPLTLEASALSKKKKRCRIAEPLSTSRKRRWYSMGLFDLFSDVADIISAPVKVVAEVASVVTKPIANVANAVVEEVKELTRGGY
jgi:hypothetical protein